MRAVMDGGLRDGPFGVRGSDALGGLLFPALLGAGGVVAGVVGSTGNPLYAALALAAIIGLAIASAPRLLFWLTLIGALVVTGLARLYVPSLQEVRWLVALAAWVLGAYALLEFLVRPQVSTEARRLRVPGMVILAVLFVALCLVTSFLNWPGTWTFISGLKGYFQTWGLLLALVFLPWPPAMMERLPRFLLAVAFVQLPFVFHQYFLMAPSREALGQHLVAVDVIAGTFGAQPEGGGANAVLAAFLVMVIVGVVSTWREGLLSGRKALVLALPLMFPLAINEAKVAAVYMLVGLGLLYGRDFARRPLRFFGGAAAIGTVLVMLVAAYTAFAPTERAGTDWRSLVAFAYESNFVDDYNNQGELTRGGALGYWADHHGWRNLPQTMLGHGVGVSRLDSGGGGSVDAAAIDPNIAIGRTAVTALLWETGLMGLGLIGAMLASAFWSAGRLARAYAEAPRQRALFRAAQAAVLILAISIWHKNFFVYHLPYQALFVVVLGYIGYWERWAPAPGAEQARSERAP